MRKFLWIVILTTLALSACSGDGRGQATAPATSAPPGVDLPVTPTSGPECTAIKAIPTPGPEEESLFPPVAEDEYVRGPADAPVTIIEYGDFQ
ncbi:MAG: hypothetical protein GXP40_06045 [Chloroflexi bacterium]|nr:hypothetical protein [Chloroflexota bacterium]